MSTNKRVFTIGIIVVAILLVLCTACICGGAALLVLYGQEVSPPATASRPTVDILDSPEPTRQVATPTPEAVITPEMDATGKPTTEAQDPLDQNTAANNAELAQQTLLTLEDAEIPIADLHELAIRYLGVPADTSRTTEGYTEYYVGDTRYFSVSNLDEDKSFDIKAELVYKTDHVYMWVEENVDYDQQAIIDAANLFEEHTYVTNRNFFGSEWTPGVDNDPHLTILHAKNLGSTVAGYFSSADSFVKAVRSDSNEAEMFYIHLSWGVTPYEPFYNGVLAHEFQHMIHWYNDRNEDTWLNEGMSELAMELNDRFYPGGRGMYDVGGSELAYLDKPDTQLNNWPESSPGNAAPNYGAAYLFTSYFLERFGEQATQALVSHPENGMRSVDLVMSDDLGLDENHLDLYADWLVANLLDQPELGDGRYGYSEISVGAPRLARYYDTVSELPADGRTTTVHQYGVDYIEVNFDKPLVFTFDSDDFVGMLDTEAYRGDHLWWSNRQDESDTRLTRVFDLSDASKVDLSYFSWYEIEEDWDYAYVAVGTTASGIIPADLGDSEISWQILDDRGLNCTTHNPNNGSLGCGITGKSSSWTEHTVSLDKYAGQEIALRFEYITDAAVNQAGLALDDIKLVIDDETVFFDDAENEIQGWMAEGFVRVANVLPQEWIIELVTYGDTVKVEHLRMPGTSGSEWTIPMDNNTDRAVIIISAIAPYTSVPATYTYTLDIE